MSVPPFILDLGPLSEDAKLVAKNELRETPEVVELALKELRAILDADPSIYYRTDDDDFLLIFLRPTKFYAQSAYELMKRIAEFREKYKDLLDGLLPEHEKDAFINHNVVNVLTERDDKGRRVLIVNCGGTWDTSKVTSDQLFRLFYLIHLGAILEPETQVRGSVVIMDYKGLGMKQVGALSPSFSMKLLSFIQDAMPLRLKEIHMINEPFIFSLVWKIFQPFIKEKLKGRIYFHRSKMSSLHAHIKDTHLPSNYGGKLPAINYSGKDWYPVIEEHVDHIQRWNSYGLVKK
ncbi:alpha-tocopherol transfer protein-related [Holotrichia oblita]|uniref:Alpha-tocopherol transfer protein-related n=1 Tax=Holotrichia oblita TaxID=644536 RepID=A0ACB9TGP6_HOLOL|nr:alpha-tocopherol transfer protein-related [Holotrichia oblita]